MRSKQAYAWITEVDHATSWEALADSGDFEELDMKLSTALSDIAQGAFKKQVLVVETELSNRGLILNGRQIAWMLYEYFNVTDTDGAMLD